MKMICEEETIKDTVAGLELFAIANHYGCYLECDKCGCTIDAPRINVGTPNERISSDKNALLKEAEVKGWLIYGDKHYCGECK